MNRGFGVHYNVTYLPVILHQLGFSPQKPEAKAVERNEERIRSWGTQGLESLEKKARRTGATIVLIDESAFLLSPPCQRHVGSPVGQTPVVKTKTGGRRKVSVIGALSVDLDRKHVEFLFQVLKGENVEALRFRSFLAALLQTLRGKLILVFDNLVVHHAAMIERFVLDFRHRLSVAYLPPYAPELNPVENVWNEMKYHKLANYAPPDLDALEKKTVEVGVTVNLEKRLLRSCLSHSPLLFWRT